MSSSTALMQTHEIMRVASGTVLQHGEPCGVATSSTDSTHLPKPSSQGDVTVPGAPHPIARCPLLSTGPRRSGGFAAKTRGLALCVRRDHTCGVQGSGTHRRSRRKDAWKRETPGEENTPKHTENLSPREMPGARPLFSSECPLHFSSSKLPPSGVLASITGRIQVCVRKLGTKCHLSSLTA